MMEEVIVVKSDLRNNCESESVELGCEYLNLMLSSGCPDRILYNRQESRIEWKKMYLLFMNESGVSDVNRRDAYQVLYNLSRHYEVCEVKDDIITWNCSSLEEAKTKLKIGQLRAEVYHLYEELQKAQNEIKRLRNREPDEYIN